MLLLIYPQITLAEDKNLEIERGKATTYRVMAEFVVYEIKPLDIQETRKYKEEREKKEKEEQESGRVLGGEAGSAGANTELFE